MPTFDELTQEVPRWWKRGALSLAECYEVRLMSIDDDVLCQLIPVALLRQQMAQAILAASAVTGMPMGRVIPARTDVLAAVVLAEARRRWPGYPIS